MINVDNEFSKTKDGVWAEFEGSRFLIAHMSNLRFQRKLANLRQPHLSKINRNTIDPKLSQEITCKAMSVSILLGWDQVVNSAGEKVEFTEELAASVLIKQPDVREFVSDYAVNLEHFRDDQIEQTGN